MPEPVQITQRRVRLHWAPSPIAVTINDIPVLVIDITCLGTNPARIAIFKQSGIGKDDRIGLIGAQGLDDLFDVRYIGDKRVYEPGRIAKREWQKLPAQAVAVAQRLSLWLPGDARLLWQLAALPTCRQDLESGAAYR